MTIKGPKLKLARADEHIKDLENLFETFISDNPYHIETHPIPNESKISVTAVFGRPIPFRSSAIIGDVLHNLRSSLDHLVAIGIKANGNKPGGRTGFPICEKETIFNKEAPEKLRGASDSFVAFVGKYKPYRNNEDPRLYVLSKLNNIDKHNYLIPTIGLFNIKNFKVTNKNGEPLLHVGFYGYGESTINVGQIEDVEELKIEFDSDSSIRVIFSKTNLIDGEPIISYLKSLHEICREIIESAAGNGVV